MQNLDSRERFHAEVLKFGAQAVLPTKLNDHWLDVLTSQAFFAFKRKCHLGLSGTFISSAFNFVHESQLSGYQHGPIGALQPFTSLFNCALC